jgi:uncharacterized protein (DUF433 family)
MDSGALVKVDPEVQGGTPCFAGTRVPIKSLFDALQRGRSIEYFLEQFPTVSRNQVVGVLGHTAGGSGESALSHTKDR